MNRVARRQRPLRIALVWSQFGAYHIDRCEAVARRLTGKAQVLAVEMATATHTYAWEPSGDVAGARKITLFPGRNRESLSFGERFGAQLRVLRRCDYVFIGVPYSRSDVIALSVTLRLLGVQVIAMNDSKFDDKQRSVLFELVKSCVLVPYSAAIVAGARQYRYMRFLGFRNRPVLPGYDTIGVKRVRAQSEQQVAPSGTPYEERDFLFVGRFVEKKNLPLLLAGYAQYVRLAGTMARRLVLAGSGPLEAELRQMVLSLGIGEKVVFTGFLGPVDVARQLAQALALVLVSGEEQWGLVVNEAVALGLPVIASLPVGAGDALVRNMVNGLLVEPASKEGIARSMLMLATDQAQWTRMAAASAQRAWFGDAERLADAVELILDPDAAAAGREMARLRDTLGI
ncbi:glycosyltransferase family 4 protein [Croceicoccus sp. F390]|uniref:Glycosyltransferase family 4 protein n=1 Tax=Croceicoccus esteveae TaxID=3075597 RepID=A0ABU2ZGL1_9SPHN|nr:glycosyltransferase family 4 protein [Croceicoccus sp. F390]MDT0575725.1 glycosyltransferase family 4 protein [Croceicoccus sp. F390]